MHMHLSFINLKNKDFRRFLGFCLEPYTHKRKVENYRNSTKTLQYENVASKTVKMLLK